MKRRFFLVLCASQLVGCTSGIFRSQSPEPEAPAEPETKLVGDLARPYGMNSVQVEGISLVTGLRGTGEDPAPSPQRAALLMEMQRRQVPNAAQVLASPDTALVLVRGYLRPGMQKGDTFDVEVRTPSRSETTSLRNGYLLETRLTEFAVLENRIHTGHLLALSQGDVLVEPEAEKQDENSQMFQTRGRVLGGGVALKSRVLGLVLSEEDKAVRNSQQIGMVLNRRFHLYMHGIKQGVAKPKTDEFIELAVHPRYKENIDRYMRVVRNVAFRETTSQTETRLGLLQRQLLDPVTAASAAIRLEAIGKLGIEALREGLKSSNPEVRFYAAEALAYLDQTEAAPALGQTARNEPAFRVYALAALAAMNDLSSQDELRELLSVESAETRYGAFRAIWTMNPSHALIRGETLNGKFSYHVLDVPGPAMVHVTRSSRPEIVLFDSSQTFRFPMVLEAGKHIFVNAREDQGVVISRFEPGKPDQKRVVSSKVDDVIRGIVELGGTYPDVVQALQQAKQQGALVGRYRVDALPESGRVHVRETPEFNEEDKRFDDLEETASTKETTGFSWLTPWKKS